jgi:hypothetical protein
VPAVAGHERRGGADHQPLDALGHLLREREPDAAPVVDDEREAVEPLLVDEGAQPACVALDRVVEARELVRLAEAR